MSNNQPEPRLADRLRPFTPEFLDNISMGEVHQFEVMTKVDFDYFLRRINPQIQATDEFGHPVWEEDGETPVMIPDPEAANNPQPIPNKTKCLGTLVWLVNRKHIPGLTVQKVEEQLTYRELWIWTNTPPPPPAEEGDGDVKGNPSPLLESPNEPLPAETVSTVEGS